MGRATDEIGGYGVADIWVDEARNMSATVALENAVWGELQEQGKYPNQRRVNVARVAKNRAKAKAARKARKGKR